MIAEIGMNSKLFKFSKMVHPIKSYDHFCATIRSCSGLPKFFRQENCTAFTLINLIRRETPQNITKWCLGDSQIDNYHYRSISPFLTPYFTRTAFSTNIFTSNFDVVVLIRVGLI